MAHHLSSQMSQTSDSDLNKAIDNAFKRHYINKDSDLSKVNYRSLAYEVAIALFGDLPEFHFNDLDHIANLVQTYAFIKFGSNRKAPWAPK